MRSNFSKGMLRKTHLKFSAVLVFVFCATTPVAGQFLHPKVGKETTIRTIAILPAKVAVVRDSMKGPEGMAAESEELSTRVEEAVAEVLKNKKQITRAKLQAPAVDAGDAQAKYTAADLQAKFDDLLPKVMKKRSDVKKGRFTMGDEVLNLNLDKNVDAIVFIRGQGKKLTGGKTAFTILVGGTPAYLLMQIGIVDARTGEVLVYTDPAFGGDPTTAVDRLRKALEKGFKKIPAAGTQTPKP
ncbi:MAG: hypothetical protein ACKVQW_02685 [Pyrinomonadaceae bacterium]